MMATWRVFAVALVLLTLETAWLLTAPVAQAQARFSGSFERTGLVERPKTFVETDLIAYPAVTMTASFGAGQGFQTGRFTGVQLWDLLQEAGVIPFPHSPDV